MAKTVIPVIVGLSLSFCGLAGAFYYYYLAKAKEDEEAIKTGKIEDSGKKMTFLVQNHQVPLIIGRNSKVIEKIEKDTTTKIKFEKKDDISHLCVIEGEMPEKVIEARDLIDQKRNGPHLETDEVFVGIENDKVALSGKAQEEIAKTTQAKIWIDPKNTRAGGTTRRVLVTGTRKQIDEAKTLIIERSKEPSPEADDSTPAQPINVVIPKGSTEKLDTIDQSGKQIDVYVSNVESPSKFYVQIVGSQTTNLDMLTHEMTDYYDINDNRKFHKLEEPSLGQIVAARFKLDDRWYRAKIVTIQPNEFKNDEIAFDVIFLDYGDREYVNKSHICELRPDFLSLRFQAIDCYLADVEPIGKSGWHRAAIQRFEELTHVGESVKMPAKVVKPDATPGLQLYDYNDQRDRSIAHILVQEGLAKSTAKTQEVTNVETLTHDSTILNIPGQPGVVTSPKFEETNQIPDNIQEVTKIDEIPVEKDLDNKSKFENSGILEQIPEETPEIPNASDNKHELEPEDPKIFQKESDTVLEIPEDSKESENKDHSEIPQESDKESHKLEFPEIPVTLEVEKESEKIMESSEIDNPNTVIPEIDISNKSGISAENIDDSEKVEQLPKAPEPIKQTPEPSTNGTSEFPKESESGASSSRNFPEPSMNGKSNKNKSKNKSKVLNDFISNERGGPAGPKHGKSGKKGYKTQDWNDLMNE